MKSAGASGQGLQDVLKRLAVAQRVEERLDRDRPAAEGQIRLLQQTLQTADRLVKRAGGRVKKRVGECRFRTAAPAAQRIDRRRCPRECSVSLGSLTGATLRRAK